MSHYDEQREQWYAAIQKNDRLQSKPKVKANTDGSFEIVRKRQCGKCPRPECLTCFPNQLEKYNAQA